MPPTVSSHMQRVQSTPARTWCMYQRTPTPTFGWFPVAYSTTGNVIFVHLPSSNANKLPRRCSAESLSLSVQWLVRVEENRKHAYVVVDTQPRITTRCGFRDLLWMERLGERVSVLNNSLPGTDYSQAGRYTADVWQTVVNIQREGDELSGRNLTLSLRLDFGFREEGGSRRINAVCLPPHESHSKTCAIGHKGLPTTLVWGKRTKSAGRWLLPQKRKAGAVTSKTL